LHLEFTFIFATFFIGSSEIKTSRKDFLTVVRSPEIDSSPEKMPFG
jgi:hypothetical protein